jgi:hypothetical protein
LVKASGLAEEVAGWGIDVDAQSRQKGHPSGRAPTGRDNQASLTSECSKPRLGAEETWCLLDKQDIGSACPEDALHC